MSAGPLEGATVLVAGAGGAAGAATAARLAAAGSVVLLSDTSMGRLQPVVDQVREGDGRCEATVVDLLDETAVRSWVDEAEAAHGQVDGLVHLVGGWRGGHPIAEAPTAEWTDLEGPLIRTVLNTVRASRNPLADARRGRFVLVSSREATRPTNTNAAYAAAKAAAETWTLALADSFTGTTAAATILVVKALLTPTMRRERPDSPFEGFTSVDELAQEISGLWSAPADQVNGTRVWLTERD